MNGVAHDACAACLRRAVLVARLAPRIAGLLDRPRARVAGLLGLSESDLLEAVAGPQAGRVLDELDRLDVGAEREALADKGVAAFCRHSPAYPTPLLELGDPPAVLFALGTLERLGALRDEPVVAIVGTRNPSPYGIEVAYSLGRGLGAAGVPVVSGLALGIDATAHRGCLAGNGMPVAVLACGPDVIYPRRHRRLHERVHESGIVLSELPPGTQPFRWSFPARNRIMAGLARMTVVVEAADPSGSLITTDFARDLGRSVAAVPGRVTSRVARGTNGLLRDGAVPITGAEDVLDELFGAGMRRLSSEEGRRPEPDDPQLARVLEAAERFGSVGAIADAVGLGSGETRAALGRLEADGYLVRRELGGWERTLGGGEAMPED
ncbi:MAG TPA: DNA-processing protein DprA [Thermoleophilaceae bacterium]|nr:DNA-processing protein DprA [Thermoleophilaceae bacterium]